MWFFDVNSCFVGIKIIWESLLFGVYDPNYWVGITVSIACDFSWSWLFYVNDFKEGSGSFLIGSGFYPRDIWISLAESILLGKVSWFELILVGLSSGSFVY